LSSTVRAILAQRLIRVLCSKCKVEYTPSEAELLSVGLETVDRQIYKTNPGGCRQCRQTGYKGRSGLYELLIPSPEIKDLVKDSKSDIEIKKLAVEQGMSVLEKEGHQFLLDGKTTIEELVRVL
jgi:type II secretory ATPase GspE/PulE/Tfp pilus assembly ATPase PilB-like protein